MRREKFWIFLSIGLMLGVVTQANFGFGSVGWAGLAIVIVLASINCLGLRLVWLLLAGFLLGALRLEMTKSQSTNHFWVDSGREVEILARVSSRVVESDYGGYQFEILTSMIEGENIETGIRVYTYQGGIREGDQVSVIGQIESAQNKLGQKIIPEQIETVTRGQSLLGGIKQRLIRGIELTTPEPIDSLLIGLLIGGSGNLPVSIKQDFLKLGLTHVIAVSGANLTILVLVFRRFIFPGWRKAQLVGSLALVWGFSTLVNFEASIVRAAVMLSIIFGLKYYARKVSILTCLFLTALVCCLYNPGYLVEDLGWQLSFLSLLGIMTLESKLYRLLFFLPVPKLLRQGFAVSLSAQLATYPVTLYHFGQLAPLSFIANILILPIASIGTGLAAIVAGLGIILGDKIRWLLMPAFEYIVWTLKVLRKLADLTISSWTLELNLSSAMVLAGLIALLVLVRAGKLELDPSGIVKYLPAVYIGFYLIGCTVILYQSRFNQPITKVALEKNRGQALLVGSNQHYLLIDGNKTKQLWGEIYLNIPLGSKMDYILYTRDKDDFYQGQVIWVGNLAVLAEEYQSQRWQLKIYDQDQCLNWPKQTPC
ncbi:ComEC/Rec2 family competence protein [Candidatus Saccharibacteria bacterium]|nr:ComEC/Rec2 family competence protein [Candidatus Saccharibacteria bacterium]MCB9834591.1 ComEC/Rec2 family competence protein [Candidatus Nomurabacteria bacterium]